MLLAVPRRPEPKRCSTGVTIYGGANNLGTVWKITPSGTETVLWSFWNGTDGALPVGLSLDEGEISTA